MNTTVLQEQDVLKERHAERWALDTCRSATFSGCLTMYGVAPTITAISARGKELTIHASDVYAARRRFLAGPQLDLDACALTTVGDKLVEMFLDWLLHEYSDRYRSLVSEEQQAWLRRVAILVIARHLMEQKFRFSSEQGQRTFADAWAGSEMCRLQLLNTLAGELARLVHHIVRDPGRAGALIDQFHADLEARMRSSPFALPEALPPLPDGVPLPFALLSQPEERYEPRAAI